MAAAPFNYCNLRVTSLLVTAAVALLVVMALGSGPGACSAQTIPNPVPLCNCTTDASGPVCQCPSGNPVQNCVDDSLDYDSNYCAIFNRAGVFRQCDCPSECLNCPA